MEGLTGEPVDLLLMLLLHNARFWNCNEISGIAEFWQFSHDYWREKIS